MTMTWQAFVAITVSCALMIVWGNWKNRTPTIQILVTGAKYLGLTALMLAAFIKGNYLMLLVAISVLLTVVIRAKCGRTPSVYMVNKLMLAGAVIGFFITHSALHLAEAANHKGPGYIHYTGGFGQYGGLEGDAEFADDYERVSESVYKDYEYRQNALILGLAILAWVYCVAYARNSFGQRANQFTK